MKRKRLHQIVVSLAAVFSLFVSAVSACACSHHQPAAKAEVPSCHGSAHEQTTTQRPVGNGQSDQFNSGCNCFVKTPVPAITAKAESKKSAGKIIAALTGSERTAVRLAVFSPAVASLERPRLLLSAPHLLSGPSRAPPRL